jgi:hypothetical protein
MAARTLCGHDIVGKLHIWLMQCAFVQRAVLFPVFVLEIYHDAVCGCLICVYVQDFKLPLQCHGGTGSSVMVMQHRLTAGYWCFRTHFKGQAVQEKWHA